MIVRGWLDRDTQIRHDMYCIASLLQIIVVLKHQLSRETDGRIIERYQYRRMGLHRQNIKNLVSAQDNCSLCTFLAQ